MRNRVLALLWGLGLVRQQPIERPKLRIQPLPAALDQFGALGWPLLAWKWCS
ncbi:MAG: hypothetical protein ACI9IO_000244 [Cyanobium sp.]|jgi:hypothetical protein